jgi:endonuclease III
MGAFTATGAGHISEVAKALRRRHGNPRPYGSGDLLGELVFLLCSTKTNARGYRSSYRELRRAYPTSATLARAPEHAIARALRGGGLARTKARAIRKMIGTVEEVFGKPTLAPLRAMPDAECEAFLLGLPGVGPKVARCMMMFALGRRVFPVDTHVWRIACRLGWARARPSGAPCTRAEADRLQGLVPPRLRFALHVNLIAHGRSVCTARAPACGDCPVARWCPRIGVAPAVRRRAAASP